MPAKYNNILIVEDEAVLLMMMNMMLQKSSFVDGQVHQALNGKQALEKLCAHHIDLIITDINMPVMNGFELMEQIQNHADFREIPLIAATSEFGDKLLNRLAFMGHGYLRKPFYFNDLETQLSKQITQNNDYYLYG